MEFINALLSEILPAGDRHAQSHFIKVALHRFVRWVKMDDLAELRLAATINVAAQNYAFLNGKIERLERETDRLEVGFVLLSILAGSAISALCALAFRDAGLKRQRTAGKLPAESEKHFGRAQIDFRRTGQP